MDNLYDLITERGLQSRKKNKRKLSSFRSWDNQLRLNMAVLLLRTLRVVIPKQVLVTWLRLDLLLKRLMTLAWKWVSHSAIEFSPGLGYNSCFDIVIQVKPWVRTKFSPGCGVFKEYLFQRFVWRQLFFSFQTIY